VHGVAVGDDAGFAGDTGPFTAVVEEAGVDVRVRGEVVGLSGFSVCMEDQIGSFLCEYALVGDNEMKEGTKRYTLAARAMQRLTMRPLSAMRVAIMQNLHLSMNSSRSPTFSESSGFWRFF